MNKQQKELIINGQHFNVFNTRFYANEIVKYLDNHQYSEMSEDKINYLKRLTEHILNNLNDISELIKKEV